MRLVAIVLIITATTASKKQIINNGKSRFGKNSQAKCEKLARFINLLILAIMIESMIIKKDVWNIIFIGPHFLQEANTDWNKENKENQMTI